MVINHPCVICFYCLSIFTYVLYTFVSDGILVRINKIWKISIGPSKMSTNQRPLFGNSGLCLHVYKRRSFTKKVHAIENLSLVLYLMPFPCMFVLLHSIERVFVGNQLNAHTYKIQNTKSKNKFTHTQSIESMKMLESNYIKTTQRKQTHKRLKLFHLWDFQSRWNVFNGFVEITSLIQLRQMCHWLIGVNRNENAHLVAHHIICLRFYCNNTQCSNWTEQNKKAKKLISEQQKLKRW